MFSYLEHWYIFWMIPDSLKLLSLNLFHSDNMKLLSVIFHGFWQFQDIWNIVSFYFCIFIDFDFVDNQNLLLVSEVFRSYIFDTFSVFVSLHKSEIFHIIVAWKRKWRWNLLQSLSLSSMYDLFGLLWEAEKIHWAGILLTCQTGRNRGRTNHNTAWRYWMPFWTMVEAHLTERVFM